MIQAILGFLTALPKLVSAIESLIAAIGAHEKAVRDSAITMAQTDMNKAKTSDEIKKAAQETSDAFGKL